MTKPVAIITGAGRGIGRAAAIELSQCGYQLVLVSRNKAELRETAKLSDKNALIAPADVAAVGQIRGVVAKTLEAFGRIDAVVNNAGYAPVRSIESITDDEWQSILDVNLSAAVWMCKAVWATFRKQNRGVIVNISSKASADPFTGLGLYGSAKAALNVLGLSLAREGEAIGVRVHTIAPGAVETAMLRTILTPEQYPTQNTLSPAEVASVIADCVTGSPPQPSGEVIWLTKQKPKVGAVKRIKRKVFGTRKSK